MTPSCGSTPMQESGGDVCNGSNPLVRLSTKERPVSAHLPRCRALQRRSPNRARNRRSARAAGTGLHAPKPTLTELSGIGRTSVSPPDRRPRRLRHEIFGGIEHIALAPVGRLLTRPRKERLASAVIAAAVASVACTNSGGTMLGSLWAHPNSTSSCRARYWSESPGGTCTHRKAPPCHDAPPFRSFA